jgi:hypothetical protein
MRKSQTEKPCAGYHQIEITKAHAPSFYRKLWRIDTPLSVI